MKKLLCIFLIACGSLLSAQTLDDYLVMAAENNPLLKAKFMEYQAALEKVPQVAALPDPEVSFGYFISPVETRVGAQEARLGAMQMFPWFGTLGAKKEVKTELAKAKYELFQQAKKELFYKLKEAYYNLFELEQSIRITEAHLEILRAFESLATTKFENGKTGMVDVLRIQMDIAELKNNLLFLKDKKLPLTAAFNQSLNRDIETAVLLPDTLEVIEFLLNKKAIRDSIQWQNDLLESVEHMQLAAEHSVKVARKAAAPSIGLGMNYVVVSERRDMAVPDNGKDAFMPLLSIKLPLYRGKYKAMVKEADLNLQLLESMEIEYRNMLKTKLETAWLKYSDAGRRITLYQQQMKVAEQAQNILVEAYSTDEKDFEEILRVQAMLLKYELEVIKAIADKNSALAIIESLM